MPQISNLQERVKTAWAKLPDDLKAKLGPQILIAQQHLLNIRSKAAPATTGPTHRELMMVQSLLHGDQHGLLRSAAGPRVEGILTSVGPDGVVHFGGVDYDGTDPGWAYVIVALAETLGSTPPFPSAGQVIQIPDDATLALLGDWGGGNQFAQSVAAAVTASAPPATSYYIHLGDVYYAGTNGGATLDSFETTNFLNVWPGASGRSFALNSNHDMYAHGTGYFGTTLAPGTAFGAQKGASFFALYNTSFRIVGLDSAYYSKEEELYQFGSLGDPAGPQAVFLQQQAAAAASAGQNLIVMTHHNGLSLDGGNATTLWGEVANQLSALSGKSVCWYWGHEHAGAVYQPQKINDVKIYPRVCGHGCIPWGRAKNLHAPGVLWSENQLLGPGLDYFVTNGYATLQFNGASVNETFYNQSGAANWTGTWPPA